MKGFIVLADGFEDVEAIAVMDVLKRANIELDWVGFNDVNVLTQTGINITLKKTLKEIDYHSYDFLIIPGGKATFNYLDTSSYLSEIITYFCENKKLVAAICAAPSQIGKLGYLKDLPYTVFPGCGSKIIGGTLKEEAVVITDNIITARSMYYANDFALAIIEKLLGKETKERIEKQIKGLL